MTVDSTSARVNYLGAGNLAEYDFSFRIFKATDLKVFTRNKSTNAETELALTTDYTVSINNDGTGSITLVAGDLETGVRLFITRNIPVTQEVGLSSVEGFFPDNIEEALDRGVMVNQYLEDASERSIKVPPLNPSQTFNAELPIGIVGNGNKSIVTNDDGDGLVVGPSTTELSTVAGSIDNIDAVGDNIDDVTTVADDLNAGTSHIETVSGSIDDINELGPIASSISTVASASYKSKVIEVANDLLLGDDSTITTVAGIESDVTTVASNSSNVSVVADDIDNVNTVADDIADVSNVASNNANVTLVADDIDKVNAVADDITDVNTVADNISDIRNVSDNVIDINQVSSDASSAAASAAAATAINNLTVVNTLVQMRSLSQQSNGTCVIVLELSGRGDGAGGIYQYHSTSTLTEVEGKIYAPTTNGVAGRYIDVQGTAPIDIRKLRGLTNAVNAEIDNSDYSDITTWSTSSKGLGYGIQSHNGSVDVSHKATCPIDIRGPGSIVDYTVGDIANTHINLTYKPDDINDVQAEDSAKIVFGSQYGNGARSSSPNAWIRGGRTNGPTSGSGYDDGAVWIGTAETTPNGVQDRIMINPQGSIIPVSPQSHDQDLGSSTKRFGTLYCDSFDVAEESSFDQELTLNDNLKVTDTSAGHASVKVQQDATDSRNYQVGPDEPTAIEIRGAGSGLNSKARLSFSSPYDSGLSNTAYAASIESIKQTAQSSGQTGANHHLSFNVNHRLNKVEGFRISPVLTSPQATPEIKLLPGIDDRHDIGSTTMRWDDIYATNGTVQTSDRRLKDEIKTTELGLDFINRLIARQYKYRDQEEHTVIRTEKQPVFTETERQVSRTEVQYEESLSRWIERSITETITDKMPVMETVDIHDEDGNVIRQEERQVYRDAEVSETIPSKSYSRRHYGLVAQEVEQVLSDLGINKRDFAPLIDNSDRKGLRYTEFISILIKAVQELFQRLEVLENA